MRPRTNEEVVEAYLDWLRDVKGARASTVYQYAGKLHDLVGFLGGVPLADVTTQSLELWLQRPRGGRAHGEKGSPATLQRDAVIVGNLYRYGRGRGWFTADPTELLVTPPVKNRNPKPVEDGVWIPLWSRRTLSDEARVVLGLGYYCGFRRAEMAGLRRPQVDLARRRFVGFTRKGGGDDVLDFGELLGVYEDCLPHLVPGGVASFMDPLRRVTKAAPEGEALLRWRPCPDGGPDPHQVYRRFKRWGCDFTPHQLRHSFVTNLLRAEVPVQLVSNLANHSSLNVTMRYAKLGGQDLRAFRKRQRTRWESEQ